MSGEKRGAEEVDISRQHPRLKRQDNIERCVPTDKRFDEFDKCGNQVSHV
jgi:hypothetical protein